MTTILSCKNNDNLNYIEINLNSEEIIDVQKFRNNRGSSILNEEFIIFSYCPLDFEDNYPEWIKRRDEPIFSLKNSKNIPTLYDIRVPYRLIKHKNEDFFYVIKNNDSLKFQMIDY